VRKMYGEESLPFTLACDPRVRVFYVVATDNVR
jgi:hypothetical protein